VVLHADGGIMAGNSFAASGAPDVTVAGPDARPFDALHRDFIARHGRRFAGNNRMAMPLQTMRRMEPGKPAVLRAQMAVFPRRAGTGWRAWGVASAGGFADRAAVMPQRGPSDERV
jgi:deoxyribodipyrimidine photolyase-related protein